MALKVTKHHLVLLKRHLCQILYSFCNNVRTWNICGSFEDDLFGSTRLMEGIYMGTNVTWYLWEYWGWLTLRRVRGLLYSTPPCSRNPHGWLASSRLSLARNITSAILIYPPGDTPPGGHLENHYTKWWTNLIAQYPKFVCNILPCNQPACFLPHHLQSHHIPRRKISCLSSSFFTSYRCLFFCHVISRAPVVCVYRPSICRQLPPQASKLHLLGYFWLTRWVVTGETHLQHFLDPKTNFFAGVEAEWM